MGVIKQHNKKQKTQKIDEDNMFASHIEKQLKDKVSDLKDDKKKILKRNLNATRKSDAIGCCDEKNNHLTSLKELNSVYKD